MEQGPPGDGFRRLWDPDGEYRRTSPDRHGEAGGSHPRKVGGWLLDIFVENAAPAALFAPNENGTIRGEGRGRTRAPNSEWTSSCISERTNDSEKANHLGQ